LEKTNVCQAQTQACVAGGWHSLFFQVTFHFSMRHNGPAISRPEQLKINLKFFGTKN